MKSKIPTAFFDTPFLAPKLQKLPLFDNNIQRPNILNKSASLTLQEKKNPAVRGPCRRAKVLFTRLTTQSYATLTCIFEYTTATPADHQHGIEDWRQPQWRSFQPRAFLSEQALSQKAALKISI